MQMVWKRVAAFLGVYVGLLAALWGIAEAFTYFTDDTLKIILGDSWVLIFYGIPLVAALLVSILIKPKADIPQLTRAELEEFTRASVDPKPFNTVRRPTHNIGLSDTELRRRIIERNRDRKPTYLLRMEYERRLGHRGL